ncbi:MAG TPA: DEAD/DEAH box helicase [Vicinamibacterales bacterium]|nr:DEAD/DEAH box helicase [Vicinamibacterales bacterium]
MPFSQLNLHPDLVLGLKDLGFVRPTPIQADSIPPALAGRDLLACAMTGSGKTAAFLLPILHKLIGRPRGTTRALVLTPTRELAAQILEDLTDLAVHTPINAAAVFGGVGMGPQEHAFRSGVDVIVATPGRLLDHFRFPYAKLAGLEFLVLDEADRMLDMGFLPDIRRVLRHLPQKRQTLFFSATMPAPIAELSREMLKDPAAINLERKAAPAVGITQALYPVPQHLKAALLVHLLKKDEMADALVFTRTKHRADRLARHLVAEGVRAERIHGNRSQAQRTEALAGFKNGKYQVLVATDIAARGIDVTELGHVVNFDVPAVPEDYIHRVGRTARAEATGTAFTFVAPEEEGDVNGIERAIQKRLPRVTVPDFDYKAAGAQKLEIPIAERIAAIRARKAEDRARSRAKAERRAANLRGGGGGHQPRAGGNQSSSRPGGNQTGQGNRGGGQGDGRGPGSGSRSGAPWRGRSGR